jgi:hypothetical protein
MNCFFCEKEKAVIRVKNKVGVELDACKEHGALALSKGYEFVSAQQSVQADVCPVCAGKRHIQTKSRGLVKCASCNGTGQRR